MEAEIQSIKQDIALLNAPDLQIWISEQLNEQATSLYELFTKNYPNDRLPSRDKPMLLKQPFINTLFALAPKAVCQEWMKQLMEMDRDKAIAILSNHSYFNESPIKKLAKALPEMLDPFCKWMIELSSHQIAKLLGGKNENLYPINDLLDFIPQLNENCGPFFVQSLGKLELHHRLNLFTQTSYIYSFFRASGLTEQNDVGMVYLFSKLDPSHIKLTMSLLNLVAQFNQTDAYKCLLGNSWTIMNSGSNRNLAHLICQSHGHEVVSQLIQILQQQLSSKQILSLLTQDFLCKHTANSSESWSPLEYAFSRKKNPEVALSLVEQLDHPELRPLFLNETYNTRLVEIAAINGHAEGVAYLLSQTELSQTLRKTLQQRAYALASKNKNLEVIKICKALDFYQIITQDRSEDAKAAQVKKQVDYYKKNSSSLSSRWKGGETLLHLASRRQDDLSVLSLLYLNADLTSLDQQDLTPLHHLLDGSNTKIVNLAIKKLGEQSSTNEGRQAWIKTLLSRPFTVRKVIEFEDRLKNSLANDKLRFLLAIDPDPTLLFLAEMATQIASHDEPEWQDTGRFWITKRLSQSIESEDELSTRQIEAQLIVFLYSMPVQQTLTLLNGLQLEPNQKQTLDFILAKGLTKSVIFAQLSLEEHYLFKAFLSIEAFQKLAELHFQQSDLSLLPPQLIQEFGQMLSVETLRQNARQHASPLLNLVLLEKELGIPSNLNRASILMSKFFIHLREFNSNERHSNQQQLMQLLNLTCHEEIKIPTLHFIQDQPDDSPIQESLIEIFASFTPKQYLISGSALETIFMGYLCTPEFVQPDELQQILPILKSDKIKTLLKAHRSPSQVLPQREQNTLNEALASAVLSHPQCDALLSNLLKWGQQSESVFNSFSQKLIKFLPELLQQLHPETWKEIKIEQEQFLLNYHAAAPFFQALKTTTTEDLLKTLDSYKASAALKAMAQINTHPSFKALFEFYHMNNSEGLTHIDELKIKQLLSSPNLKQQLEQLIANLQCQANQTLSIHALFNGAYQEKREISSAFTVLRKDIAQAHCTIQDKVVSGIINSYQDWLNQHLQSDEANEFILICHDLIQQLDIDSQEKTIRAINPDMMTLIIENCLNGCNSDDQERALICKIFLIRLCQQAGKNNEAHLDLIKQRLGQKDCELLSQYTLNQLADEVLSEYKDFQEATVNGVWIQRLLTSPRFIAASKPKLLQQLSERYRLLSLTLKEDELSTLTAFLKSTPLFSKQCEDSLQDIKRCLSNTPESRNHLLQKRQRVLEFRADDSIRSLFNQLEDECASNQEHGTDALAILYTYYNQNLSTLRHDLLFGFTNYAYQKALGNKGDLQVSQNILYRWLKDYLPHHNFEQTELQRKKQIWLYDEHQHQIGFLNEANQAMTFKDDEPVLLINQLDIKKKPPIYDERQRLLGHLTSTGHLLHQENLFQKKTPALILKTVPVENLSQSPPALALLINQVLADQTLSLMYDGVDKDRQLWLGQQLSQHLSEKVETLSNKNLKDLIRYLNPERVFDLLATLKNKSTARALFYSILENDELRQAWLTNSSETFTLFLNRQQPSELLSSYLKEHHNKFWFAKGLALFAESHTQAADLLFDALSILTIEASEQGLKAADYDAILKQLISTNCSSIVLKHYLKDNENDPIQKGNQAFKPFSLFFQKHHIIDTIEQLNQTTAWENNSSYRFLLHLFYHQHDSIFPAEALRLARHGDWQTQDLKALSLWVRTHLSRKANADTNHQIGLGLLEELTFRCANFGQTDLFYNPTGELNPSIAQIHFTRSTLQYVVDYFNFSKTLKNTLQSAFASLNGWLGTADTPEEVLKKQLKSANAMINWQTVMSQSWEDNNQRDLPLINAFLLNYSGPSQALTQLLQDYFKAFKSSPEPLHSISHLMQQQPNATVSHLIFNTLQVELNLHTNTLDQTLFTHMAKYYSPKASNMIDAKIALITHFGQQKQYALAIRSCELLIPDCTHPELKQKLRRATVEAQVEARLNKARNGYFFRIISFFKRLWYYGFNFIKNASKLIRFCDDDQSYHPSYSIPEKIKTKLPGGQAIEASLDYVDKTKRLRKKFEDYLKKSSDQTATTQGFSLYSDPKSSTSPIPTDQTQGKTTCATP